ncbi:mechanosensitive ion channel [Myroides sp. 1354]|uniref:mechanosensitive ion channel domain-containing protein n=1 Tax=unclassified Myroides TaxID=2642485 RepID=UPI0025774EDD|nr:MULTISPECIES: mechanosensitive ion channel domain-containing protein [unclassified Myroides]MDM1044512.1 mechanosensitive ion channel [Myroides sp. R163-1]MDM1056787.1 mechanosensitive ion channel [Myroides sp. 1354]MDM1069942.1 mechanosensitive ion channel [Myroides sp. 1372]
MPEGYLFKAIITAIAILIFLISRKVITTIIHSFSKKSEMKEGREAVVIRLFNLLLLVLLFIIIFTIWGVEKDNVLLTLTSVFTVIGVAMFAQWSLLSNITAGILLFFSFPFRIGDIIRIQDKDFPTEGRIVDIKAFYLLLITKDGEQISYPNNLLLQKGIVILSPDHFETHTKNTLQE